ncbi:MAG: hypothetical protein WC238_06070, partial [Parcubacteria group bacterium]
WANGQVPRCSECNELIPNSSQLRRYHGLSMHPSCFKKFYEKEGDEKGTIGKYWQRVAHLP